MRELAAGECAGSDLVRVSESRALQEDMIVLYY